MKNKKNLENVKYPCICVIYDSVSEKHGSPSTFINVNVAKRSFVDLLDTPPYNAHKGDYSLYEVAFYDEFSGTIYDLNEHRCLLKGSDCLDCSK